MEQKQNELFERGITIDTNGKVSFNANYFARFIAKNFEYIFLKDQCFYEYDSGVWKKQQDDTILCILRNIFQQPQFGIWSAAREREYMTAIKRQLYCLKEMNQYRHLVNMKNGMYHLIDRRLMEHKPSYYSSIQVPITYDRYANCPRFSAFIKEVFEDDVERIRIAQEWAGYLLTTETKAQKALVLLGNGENGKGVFVDTICKLVGEENISHIPLNELHKGFSRVSLFNKTVNVSGENEMNGKSFNTQYFKAIVGEDTISAEEKNKPVFSFKPTAKLVMTMNSLPNTNDTSYGYFRRLCILPFNAKFSGENRDNDLRQKLEEELPGIFLWAMEGLKRLIDNDYKFSTCKSMDQIIKQYEIDQNPIQQFFEDCIEPADEDYKEDNRIVFQSYKYWASENGLKEYEQISAQKFWKGFEDVASKKKFTSIPGRSNSFRYHTAIRVRREYFERESHEA